MEVGWVSVCRRRRRALGGEAVARPARVLSGRRSAGTSLVGGGFPCGGLGGQWAAPCSRGPFASLFLATVLWSAADDGVRRPPASGGQAWGGEGGGGLLGYAGSRPASR
jgi:hypothetical protein